MSFQTASGNQEFPHPMLILLRCRSKVLFAECELRSAIHNAYVDYQRVDWRAVNRVLFDTDDFTNYAVETVARLKSVSYKLLPEIEFVQCLLLIKRVKPARDEHL